MPVKNVSPRGFCMSCEDDTVTAGTIAVLATKVPQRGFKDALAEVRRNGRPTTLDIAESAMATLGGAAELGKMIAEDVKKLRGDYLDEELKPFHDVDYKVLRGLYDTLVKLASDRDKMVGDTGDPLADVSEDDLMAIASQAALLQIESDPEFRKKLLEAIIQADPDAVVEAAALALDEIDKRPKVEVIDARTS
jgi:hypothetical protein